MINLISVYEIDQRHRILHQLLGERTMAQSISHQGMPTWTEHCQFVDCQPYQVWCFIQDDEVGIVGSIYLTKDNEIGISIFIDYHRQGFARKAIRKLMGLHDGPFYANVNPRNRASSEMFERIGFKHIQNTYKIGG